MQLEDYTTGTVSIAKGSATLTGTGTAWDVAGFKAGDTFHAQGLVGIVASVDSDTAITLRDVWAGTSIAGGTYLLRYQPDNSRMQGTTRELLDQLRAGIWLNPDATGKTADKATYDDRPTGFRFLDVSVDPFKLYVKESDTSGDWSSGADWVGPAGDDGTPGADGADGAPGSSDVVGSSISPREIAIGSVTLNTNTSRGWGIGARLRASSDADVSNFMEGVVTAYNVSNGSLTIDIDLIGGSGTKADWTINLAGEPGKDGADGTNGTNGADGADGSDGKSFEWQNDWATDTAYAVDDVVAQSGSSYICVTAHTAGTFATDLSAGKWNLMAQKGADGTGAGDMLAATYDPQGKHADAFARANHTGTQSADTITDGTTNKAYTATEQSKLAGIAEGADVTDATSVAAAGAVMSAATDASSFGFVLDEDDMASDSDAKVPTQQSVKAHVDAIQTLLSSAANINFLQGGTGAVSRTVANKFGEIVSCKDFDVKGDGSTDDATNLQKAVDYLESLGGGVLRVPAGVYMLSSEILLQQAILLLCDGYGEDGNNASGDDTRLVTFRRTATGAAAPIFRFQSATDTQKIRGGGILGAMLDGNDVATIGVHSRSCDYQKFDLATWSLVNSAIRIDDGNNATPSFNEIWLQFIWGTGTTSAGAHALHFRGEDGTGGCTRNIIWRLNGLHKDGHMMFLDGNVDNNQAMEFNATRSSGGTGYSVKMTDGASAHPRFNRFYNFSGRIYESANAYGNEFFSVTSEQSSYEVESGVGNSIFHSIVDYSDGTPYRGPMMKMRDEIRISGGMFMPMTNFGAIASAWGAILMDDSATETVYAVVGRDQELPAGHITGVRFAFLMASANTSKSVRLQVRIETATPGTSVTIADTNESFTVPVNDTAGVLNEQTVTLSSSLAIAKGDTILFRLDRLGADALDTATGDLGILSATLLYEYSGPVNVAGGGTFAVPALP